MVRFLRPTLATSDTRSVRPAPKQRASVYGTPEYAAWQAEVIRRAGGICAICGKPRRLLADHIVEVKDGGAPLDLSNGQGACWPCNTKKGALARAARQGA